MTLFTRVLQMGQVVFLNRIRQGNSETSYDVNHGLTQPLDINNQQKRMEIPAKYVSAKVEGDGVVEDFDADVLILLAVG